MALFNCPECSGTVSTTAPSCPHCGTVVTIGATEKNSDQVIRENSQPLDGADYSVPSELSASPLATPGASRRTGATRTQRPTANEHRPAFGPMRVVAAILGVVWTVIGLVVLALGAEASSMMLQGLGAILAIASGLSVVFMIIRLDRLAFVFVGIAVILTVPLGIIFAVVALPVLRPDVDSRDSSALEEAIRRAR